MRKTTVLFFLLTLFSSCYSQKGFTIIGHVTGYKEGTRVKLQSFEDEGFEKYTTIQNSTFIFSGQVKNVAERFIITIDNGRMAKTDNCIIFIGNEDIVITADKQDFPYKAIITGSKHQDILNKINKQLAIIEPDYTKAENEYFILKRISDNKDSVRNVYHGENGKLTLFEKKNDSIYKKFITENYNSYPALHELFFRRDEFDKKQLSIMYDKLDPTLKNSRYGKGIRIFLDAPQLKEGDIAYNFEATDINGETHSLQEYFNKGKYTLLEFTKPICGASKMAIPLLKEISTERQKDLQIISYTVRDKENWMKLNKEEKITYTSLFTNENGPYGKTVLEYDIHATPTFLLLDPSGKIIKRIEGVDDALKDQLATYIK